MSWEKEEKERGMTRRDWVRVGMAAGAVGAVLGLGGLSIGQILPPPLKFSGEIRETIQYTKFPPTDPTADLWWNTKAGTAVDRKSTRLNSSHRCISYAVFCLKKKK